MTCQMLSAAASTAALVADNKNETTAVDSLDDNKDRDIRLCENSDGNKTQ